jgi:nitrogen fixation protein NifX
MTKERGITMQVAIASTDAHNVNEHFGRAERFLIYEIDGTGQTLLAIRVFAPYSVGDRSHQFSSESFAEIADKLTGCERVYCNRIGDRPAEELRKLGIEPVIYEGLISRIKT